LFETLRGLALSSLQMGVQASRMLFENDMENETITGTGTTSSNSNSNSN